MTVNKVILIGNLGQDPEVRSTKSGTSVCSLRIATNERQKDKDGNWQDHVEWHSAVVFGKTADNVGRFLSKGRQVYVEGKLRTRKWQDKEGRDRWSTEIIADNVRFLSGSKDGDSRSSGGGSRDSGGYGGSGGGYGGGGSQGGGYDDGSEIPF